MKPEIHLNNIENLVLTSKQTRLVTDTNINWPMSLWEIVFFYTETYNTKPNVTV